MNEETVLSRNCMNLFFWGGGGLKALPHSVPYTLSKIILHCLWLSCVSYKV